MKILDLTAGNRAIWYNKNNPLAVYLDHRKSMKPDVVCDVRKGIPHKFGRDFDLVVFDPPHKNLGPNSRMSKNYGHYTTKQILDLVEKGSHRAWMVTKDDGLMALKWNTGDIKLQRIFDLMSRCWEPLFGHITKDGPRGQTYWVMMRKL